MNRSCFPIFLLVTLITLQGCAPEPQQAEPVAAVVEDVAAPEAAMPAAASVAEFNTSLSVRELMNAFIEPNARQLWDGVSYVATLEGVVETIPQTQEDWDRLRTNAMALIEAGNALMLPGRRIDTAETTASRPDFQFAAEEIEQLRRSDPENWLLNLQTMQDYALQTLEAINKKDMLGFLERGALINEACETCHAQYWYKPLPMPR